MNKMSRKMEYALMALKYMADKKANDLSTAKEVSDQMHIPFDVTARVLQALSSRGLLQAEYGVSGGYKISCELQSISVHDLNEILEGHVSLTKCLAADEPCDIASTCNIVSPISELNKKVQQFYKSVSLQEVLNV